MHHALQRVKWTRPNNAAQLAASYKYGGGWRMARLSIGFGCISSNNDTSVVGKCLQGRDERDRRVPIGLNGLGMKPMRSTIELDMIRMVRTATPRLYTAFCFTLVE